MPYVLAASKVFSKKGSKCISAVRVWLERMPVALSISRQISCERIANGV